MAVPFSPSSVSLSAGSRRGDFPAEWLPVMLGVAVICVESTNRMGAGHTVVWLADLARWVGHPNGPVAMLNHALRKTGHFTGYGLLGLMFSRAWLALLRRRMTASWPALRLWAGASGVLSAAAVASADEIHQIFLPSRGASFQDVLLDTSGALVLNALVFAVLALRRSRQDAFGEFTVLGLNLPALPCRALAARSRRLPRRLAGSVRRSFEI